MNEWYHKNYSWTEMNLVVMAYRRLENYKSMLENQDTPGLRSSAAECLEIAKNHGLHTTFDGEELCKSIEKLLQ